MFGFGLSQFLGLGLVVHPRSAAPVLTALLQTGVPHRPASRADLGGERFLFLGELHRNRRPANMTATLPHTTDNTTANTTRR